jgi:hypothetical protein
MFDTPGAPLNLSPATGHTCHFASSPMIWDASPFAASR